MELTGHGGNALFISHNAVDRPYAIALETAIHELLDSDTLIDVRYSTSDEAGPQGGEKWREWIHRQVVEARTALVVVTPHALAKPWPLWEAGACAGAALAQQAVMRSAPTAAPRGYHRLTVSIAVDGDVRGAAGVYAAALAANPNSYYLADLLAQTQPELHDGADARATYRQALDIIRRLDERNTWSRATAATACIALGDLDAARTYLAPSSSKARKTTPISIASALQSSRSPGGPALPRTQPAICWQFFARDSGTASSHRSMSHQSPRETRP